MARRQSRTQDCTKKDARKRLADARKFLEVAMLVADEDDPDLEYSSVAASLAVLAGIAAADAASCHVLGQRNRSQNHRDAEGLSAQITPGGKAGAKNLRLLLDLKDSAHYGLISLGGADLKRTMRQAEQQVVFAEKTLTR